jgi:hypothetical protein
LILLIDGGQLLWALAYSFIPGCFYLIEKEFISSRPKVLIPALGLIVLGFFDVRAVYLLAIILAVRILFVLVIEKRYFKNIFYFFSNLVLSILYYSV